MIAAVCLPITFAQMGNAPITAPAFEVAAIKQNKTGDGSWKMYFTPDGLTAKGVTLGYVIREAYGVYDDHRWSGGPAWVNSDKWDIEAKYDVSEFKSPTLEQRRTMLQKLLADRFKLTVHHESKVFPLYALVLAKGGPKFQESKPGNIIHSSMDGRAMCLHPRANAGYLAFQGCSMNDLASDLTSDFDVGRTVADKTGLAERYDFDLRWAPETPSVSATPDSSGPSLFTALREQLGLKLEPIKGPLETIVIDHVERPSEN
ncbi:MAG: TIGR03435 family protein [Terracidiphilus sp.]